MNHVKPVHIETVLVEESDDRLAEVERAKRTGEPLKSVAANRSVVVPHDVATQIAEDKAKEDTYVGRFGATYAGHLESYHEALKDPEFIPMTNEEKAAAHERYSAELIRKRMDEEAHVREMMKEGYDPSIAVQQANLERANEHDQKSIEYYHLRKEREENATPVLQMIDESVRILRAEDLAGAPLEERATALQAVANVPDAMEHAATDAFITKDAIISTEVSYESEVASFEQLQQQDHPAVAIMDAAGSPEELRESTAFAQLKADNRTEEAVKAEQEMAEVASDMSLDEDSVGDIVEAAEDAVDGNKESDEMRDNPSF